MRNIFFNSQWGIKFAVSSLTATLGILSGNYTATAEVKIPERSASYLQPTAQEISQNVTPQNESQPDIELTVTGKILNQPVYSPFRREGTVKDSTRPIYVITGEEMEAQGARTVREALKFLPGILPDGTVGTEPHALSGQYIRGSNSNQVLILLDGRPINSAGYGAFDLSEFTTDNIEQIEVLPGGGSTLYGSDAIGGVINIITRRPTDKITTQAKLNVGSYGLNQQNIQISGRTGNVGWAVGYNRTQGNYNYPVSILEANYQGTRKNNDVLFNNANIKLDADLDKRNNLAFSAEYLGKEQGVPGGIPVPNTAGAFNTLTDKNRKYTDRFLSDLTWNSKLGNGNDSLLTARVYGDFINTEFDNRSGAFSTQQKFEEAQKSYGTQVTHSWKIASNQSLVYGFDYRNITTRNSNLKYATSIENVSYDNTIEQGALFAKYDVNFTPAFGINLGVRQDFSSLANGGFTSPSVGAKYSVYDSTTIRANYIKNFHIPTLFNLYANGGFYVGNPNLKPEKGDSYDIGIDQQLGNFGLLRLTYFNNTISDLIAYNNAVPVATYENVGKVRTQGIEASLNVQLAKNIYGFVNYTVNDPRILESTNSKEIGKELRFAGADSINVGISYETPKGLYAGLIMHSLGKYPTNNTNTESLPGYTTFDMKMRVPLNQTLALTGSVDNIFNQRYQLYAGYPDAGRMFQVGLNASF
ncbi:MAG: TonB-dependent receptor [Cyanomargarita calcarea GSE-NOS-MK-12-04C]|jgi:vitamin B12 transporter|uniref:TonB-dependent receptor n=1 Tax=Cyanomargarita calcarea GSE-NOS-MK-12-04C TaxID=2839659 RepID=A0A951URD7_9CYAN|nr:TonB-dependent receptor [Cyanomargarita calcarea GSE-NOS-MK-12-04C]